MAYSSILKHMLGEVRACLEAEGITRQSRKFLEHGHHPAGQDSPLVMVACSGGRDSIALASLAHTVCGMLGVRCGAVVIDHGLFEASAPLTRTVVERCHGMGLSPVVDRRIQVLPGGKGVEAAAREARYSAICDTARKEQAALVLLAHTADDQAETVLMGLLRGGGLSALAGMPRSMNRDGVRFARPLLDCTRRQTTQACRDLHLEWWDDPCNGEGVGTRLSAEYPLRSRVRHDLIPMIEEFWGSDIVTQLAVGAKSARSDQDYLERRVDELMDAVVTLHEGTAIGEASPFEDASTGEVALSIEAKALEGEHPAIRLRILSRALESLGLAPARRHVEAMDNLVVKWHGQGPIVINGGYSALRRGHVILICKDGGHANR